MKILVTTPTGKVGSELVRLLKAGKASFRLGARDVEKARKEFPGAEVVLLDYTDPASLAAAVHGISTLYLASPGDFPAERENQLIDLAKAAGATRAVKLSAMGVDGGDGPIRQVEKHLEASGLQWTFLRPTWFMQNFSTTQVQAIRAGTLAEPAGDKKTAFIDARDIAAVAFAALTQDGHAGKIYTLTGPELLSRTQVTEILSRELGIKVAYADLTDAQFREGVKPFLHQGYIDLLSLLYGFVRAGYHERQTGDVKLVLGREPGSFAQFVRDHRGVWA